VPPASDTARVPRPPRLEADRNGDRLRSCKQQRCEVNALTWHELPGPLRRVTAIAQHLRGARRELLEDPARAAVRLREIDVKETVGQEDQLAAGEQVGYLAAVEHGAPTRRRARAGATRVVWTTARQRASAVFSIRSAADRGRPGGR
jgi:hypothetical protein